MSINNHNSNNIFTVSVILTLLFASSTTSKAAQNGVVNMELWCVAKNNAADQTLQSALDWACGQGGADCRAIQQGGPCYDPSNIQKMASYVFNDYYLKHGLAEDACNFDNNAALISLDPSRGDCKFPSSKTVHGGNFTGSTTVGVGSAFGNMSGCDRIPSGWFWYVAVAHLVLVRGFFGDGGAILL